MVFHESPLLLHLYSLFEPILVDYSTLACILLDLLTCYVLGLVGDRVAVNLLQKQKDDKAQDYTLDSDKISLNSDQ